MVSPGSLCRLVLLSVLSSVIGYAAFCFHVVSNLPCIRVFYLRMRLRLIPLQSLYLFYNLSKYILLFFSYISSLLLFFLLASLASMVQFPLPYIKASRAGVFYNIILVFLAVFCGLNTLFIMLVTFKQLFAINVHSAFISYTISQIYKRLR